MWPSFICDSEKDNALFTISKDFNPIYLTDGRSLVRLMCAMFYSAILHRTNIEVGQNCKGTHQVTKDKHSN